MKTTTTTWQVDLKACLLEGSFFAAEDVLMFSALEESDAFELVMVLRGEFKCDYYDRPTLTALADPELSYARIMARHALAELAGMERCEPSEAIDCMDGADCLPTLHFRNAMASVAIVALWRGSGPTSDSPDSAVLTRLIAHSVRLGNLIKARALEVEAVQMQAVRAYLGVPS